MTEVFLHLFSCTNCVKVSLDVLDNILFSVYIIAEKKHKKYHFSYLQWLVAYTYK